MPRKLPLLPLALAASLALLAHPLAAQFQESKTIVSVPGPVPLPPARRMALLVGNASYKYPKRDLKNPVNDVRALAAKLRSLMFDVTVLEDVPRHKLKTEIDAFVKRLRPDDVALFYYSGHGTQIAGKNYLLPVDFDFASKAADVEDKESNAETVQRKLRAADVRLNIIVLDSCRTPPPPDAKDWGGRGWGPMEIGRGSIVAYATSPGEVALDNLDGNNGFYTGQLLQILDKPGLPLHQVFHETTQAVAAITGNRQNPWTAESVIGDFIFRDDSVLQKELDDVRAERIRLEAQKKKDDDAILKAKTDQQRADAVIQANLTAAKLKAQADEDARLQKQLDQDKKLKQQLAQLEKEANDRRTKLLQDAKNERESAIAIQNAPTPTATAGMTIEDARARIVVLNRLLASARTKTEADRKQELSKLEDRYAPNRALLKDDPVKSEVEKKAVWQERLDLTRQRRKDLEAQYSDEKKAIEERFRQQAANYAEDAEIRNLQSRTYAVKAPAEWVSYESESEVLTAKSGGVTFEVPIGIDPIQPLFAVKNSAGVFEITTQRTLDGAVALSAQPMFVFKLTGAAFPAHLPGTAPVAVTGTTTSGRKTMVGKDGLTYIWIEPGTFDMGCSKADTDCESDEKPVHRVTISKGFWIGETLVTQTAFLNIMKTNPSYFKGPNLPVDQVTWDQSSGYCTAIGMRLMTEAEAEYAARAGTTGVRYGDLDRIAWYAGNSQRKTHDVKTKEPNAWGLYDMLGNLWEWTGDWYDANYYKRQELTDPKGPSTGQSRVLRGGSWGSNPAYVRASYRDWDDPADRSLVIGFRCVGIRAPF